MYEVVNHESVDGEFRVSSHVVSGMEPKSSKVPSIPSANNLGSPNLRLKLDSGFTLTPAFLTLVSIFARPPLRPPTVFVVTEVKNIALDAHILPGE